ncbi:IclR family transcriptional regulator [Kineobactrum salinum]|uniref:HTH-type transcriptional repressor AllR n=1 Tax=Kineobactrum salinum TaxID=2708301 RepID=A0A6C0U0Y4_9GAMM|nr:IclR family transcriptional regulator [Kineobactrum salinum]QIB65782.1 IclR family transcriptional regulator [Kineobactrum salinum]
MLPHSKKETETGETRVDTETPGSAKGGQEPRVQSVARAVKILMAVAQSENGLKTIEISRKANLPKQATYHLVHTLMTSGMLTHNEQGLHVLGLRIGTLAEAFRRHLSPPQHLTPFVRKIANETGETAYATGWWAGEIVNLTTWRGSNPIQASEVTHGSYIDAHARASGKLLLAFADEETRSHYLAEHALPARTSQTITELSQLHEEFQLIREQGYAVDREEYTIGLHCLAVPIDAGASPYALTISAPTERFKQRFTDFLEIMRHIASDLSGLSK